MDVYSCVSELHSVHMQDHVHAHMCLMLTCLHVCTCLCTYTCVTTSALPAGPVPLVCVSGFVCSLFSVDSRAGTRFFGSSQCAGGEGGGGTVPALPVPLHWVLPGSPWGGGIAACTYPDALLM